MCAHWTDARGDERGGEERADAASVGDVDVRDGPVARSRGVRFVEVDVDEGERVGGGGGGGGVLDASAGRGGDAAGRARGNEKAKRRRFAREDGARGGEDARGEFVGGDVDVARRRARDSARGRRAKVSSEDDANRRGGVRRVRLVSSRLARVRDLRERRLDGFRRTRPRARDRERRRSRPPPRTPRSDTPRARARRSDLKTARARAFAHRSRPYTRTSSPRNPSRSSASPATRAAPLPRSRRLGDELGETPTRQRRLPTPSPTRRRDRRDRRLDFQRFERIARRRGVSSARPRVANASREIIVSSHDNSRRTVATRARRSIAALDPRARANERNDIAATRRSRRASSTPRSTRPARARARSAAMR